MTRFMDTPPRTRQWFYAAVQGPLGPPFGAIVKPSSRTAGWNCKYAAAAPTEMIAQIMQSRKRGFMFVFDHAGEFFNGKIRVGGVEPVRWSWGRSVERVRHKKRGSTSVEPTFFAKIFGPSIFTLKPTLGAAQKSGSRGNRLIGKMNGGDLGGLPTAAAGGTGGGLPTAAAGGRIADGSGLPTAAAGAAEQGAASGRMSDRATEIANRHRNVSLT